MEPTRRIIPEDIDWMAGLAQQRFAYDRVSAEAWIRNQVLPDPQNIYLAIRTKDAFLIGGLNHMAWSPTKANMLVLLLVSSPNATWQAVQLLRESISWARFRKAEFWKYHWDHGDAGVLCRRVGAVPASPRYEVNLPCHPPPSSDPL